MYTVKRSTSSLRAGCSARKGDVFTTGIARITNISFKMLDNRINPLIREKMEHDPYFLVNNIVLQQDGVSPPHYAAGV